MIYKTYISKFNTIVSNSKINTGLNPVSELVYGRDRVISRALIYFDHNKIKEQIENGTMVDMDKMKHTLYITNAGSIDHTQMHKCETSSINENYKIRATSFDLIFFLIPKHWDRGKGFDYSKTYLNFGYYSPTPLDPERLVSEYGCNWFQRESGLSWREKLPNGERHNNNMCPYLRECFYNHNGKDFTKPELDYGVYSNETLSREYDKWAAGEDSIIIGRQHFDYGNENINLDITDIVNKFIKGEKENYGIGIAYSPMLEIKEDKFENYVGFLTDKTNLFFEPYVETRYDDHISDDRANFVLGKDNKLYLYCTIGNTLENLDKLPKVTIKDDNDDIVTDSNGTVFDGIEVKQYSRGVYYVDINLSKSDFKADRMLYDTWDGLVYQGNDLEAVEMDFTLKKTSNFFNLGNSIEGYNDTFSVTITGINEREEIKRGDVRCLTVKALPSYTTNTYELLDQMDIRLYIKDGTREIDVIEWDAVNKGFTTNFYNIDTNILIPQRYYVDVRVKYGLNSIIHHNVLSFDITDDINNKYH